MPPKKALSNNQSSLTQVALVTLGTFLSDLNYCFGLDKITLLPL